MYRFFRITFCRTEYTYAGTGTASVASTTQTGKTMSVTGGIASKIDSGPVTDEAVDGIVVVGGGIGGMTAALCLARAGFAVHVVEQAPEFVELGAGIQLAPNATRVLDTLGLLAEIDECAVRPDALKLLDMDTAHELAHVDFGDSFIARYGYPYYVLHRGDLLEILLSGCRAQDRITLENNKKVVDIDGLSSHPQVLFDDGDRYICDAVVGADGLWSTTRALVSPDDPVCSSYVAYRGAIPMGQAGTSADNVEFIWIGRGRHLVQYPIRRGELYNQVVVFRSDRYRSGMAPDGAWGTPEELDAKFATACAQVRSSVALIRRERRWPMYDREPIDNWTSGRVTLLGDAAHPMLQYLAQGACQAIEDAGSLAMHMEIHGADVGAAFAAYQRDRIPRTAQVQRLARTWGDIWHTSDPVMRGLRDRVFARDSEQHYGDLDWLYRTADTSA